MRHYVVKVVLALNTPCATQHSIPLCFNLLESLLPGMGVTILKASIRQLLDRIGKLWHVLFEPFEIARLLMPAPNSFGPLAQKTQEPLLSPSRLLKARPSQGKGIKSFWRQA